MEIKILAEDQRRRNKRINFWLTETEYNEIKERAVALDLSISEYIRMLSLNADINLSLNKIKVSTSLIEAELPEGVEACDDEIKAYFTSSLENSKDIETQFNKLFEF